MITLPSVTLMTGLCLIFAGFLAMCRQYLLDPVSAHYPKAPGWLRNMMFFCATVLVFAGTRKLWAYMMSQAHGTEPLTSPELAMIATTLVIYNLAMLGNVIRQRYPREVWERLNKINERLYCNQNPMVRWFSK